MNFAGGVGGHSGSYHFINTDIGEIYSGNVHARSGSRGENGHNGSLCKNTALDIRVTIPKILFINTQFTVENSLYSDRCTLDLVSSAAAKQIPKPNEPLKFTSEIIEYKTFLRENMNDPSQAESIRKTYDAIDSNAYINKAYSVADFETELYTLDNQSFGVDLFVDVVTLYDSLLSRIEDYRKSNVENMSESDRNRLMQVVTNIRS